MKTDKGINNSILYTKEVLMAGAEIFSNQLMKMTNDKIIAPYNIVYHQRQVINLYRTALDLQMKGEKMDEKLLTIAQNKLDLAIDYAKVNNLPSDELESIKEDINHLKYEVL